MIWLVGNRGMLGSALEEQLRKAGESYVSSDREVDITDSHAVQKFLHTHWSRVRPLRWLVNCAAYTAVDQAEDEPDRAARLNALGPKNLAAAAAEHGAALIHVSTDYVFDGEQEAGYRESDSPRPISIYGRSKWAGEAAVQRAGIPYYIVRTAWLFGERGPNFVATMLRLFEAGQPVRVVDDQWGCPTYAGDLAEALHRFIQTEGRAAPGIYHFTNTGITNWYQFAREIYAQARQLELVSDGSSITPVPGREYPTKARRPHYSILHTEKIRNALDIDIRSYQDALHSYLLTIKSERNSP
ncbi:MAG: dTDP-4-dehydrorhamnose reductase [Spirochaetota bacterium]